MSGPLNVTLEADKNYLFCTCGESKDGVLCDSAHKGSDFAPMKFSVTETKDYHLCTCKKTSNAPYCDGSHAK
jgi:CDGSH-type Zn-finger protein